MNKEKFTNPYMEHKQTQIIQLLILINIFNKMLMTM